VNKGTKFGEGNKHFVIFTCINGQPRSIGLKNFIIAQPDGGQWQLVYFVDNLFIYLRADWTT
jgi:hypothetical protein